MAVDLLAVLLRQVPDALLQVGAQDFDVADAVFGALAVEATRAAASAAPSFSAVAASSLNCLVSAPHHCIGSTAGLASACAAVPASVAAAASGASGSGGIAEAAALCAAAAVGMRMVNASRRSPICTFMVCSVVKVIFCTSSAWIVAPSIRAFCSSQNCTVFSSWMRLSSSSGFSVGATH